MERITERGGNVENPKKRGSQIDTPIPDFDQENHQSTSFVPDKDAPSHSWCQLDAIQAKLGGKTETHVRVMEGITEIGGNI